MTKAAIPDYMNKHLASQDIPPGHRFGLYFPIWKDEWKKADQEKTVALKKATSLTNSSQKLSAALYQRQRSIALQNDALGYFPAISTSPFMTGIGNEHPLENGFAFLNPYGLPYLPGSSVKGVLRTAAEELALGLYAETEGWNMLSVWWLFGFDAGSAMLSQKKYNIDMLDEEAGCRRKAYQDWVAKGNYEHNSLEQFIKATVVGRDQKKYLEHPQQFLNKLPDEISNQGGLRFWDVYPQSKHLAMDILTPHHGGYFQGKNTPHDSEQPVPNFFLTIPSGSEFHFYSTCETASLPDALQENWYVLLQSAFKYAFDWLGFGAKTAVGYGQMHSNVDAEQALAQEKRLAELPPIERDIVEVLKANKDPNKKEYLVLLNAVKMEKRWQDDDRHVVVERIKAMMQQVGVWKETTNKKNPLKDKEFQNTQEVKKLLS